MIDEHLSWEADFAAGFGHTSIAYLKRCIGYESAKTGDLDAAKFVVYQCVKNDRIDALVKQFPNAKLIPVLTQNMLPLALALRIGLPIWMGVRCLQLIQRKNLSAIERLTHKPIFFGHIESGDSFIIVDDVVTQGGTVSSLRRFVILHGGFVVAIVALAYAIGSHAIAPLKENLARLNYKFGFQIPHLLWECNIATNIRQLTNSQVKYLLKFSCIGNIRKKIKNMENLGTAVLDFQGLNERLCDSSVESSLV